MNQTFEINVEINLRRNLFQDTDWKLRKFVNYLSLNFIEKVARILLKPRIAKIEIRFVSESKMERFEIKESTFERRGNDCSPCPLRFPITSYVMRIDNTSGNSSHLKQKEEGKRLVTPPINHVDVDDALHAGTNSPASVFSGNKTGNTGGHRETRQFVRVSTACVCTRLFLGPSRGWNRRVPIPLPPFEKEPARRSNFIFHIRVELAF